MEWPVRHQKRDGVLHVTDTAVQFLPRDERQPVRLVPLSRVQQILVSAVTSKLPLIKLTLDHGQSAVYEFGQSREARDAARDAIARALRRYASAAPTGASATATASAGAGASDRPPDADPLYETLVASGLVSEALYRQYAPYRQQALQGAAVPLTAAAPSPTDTDILQRRGVPTAMLADLQPTEESGRKVKYRFDPATIHQVFVEEPAVHRAYRDTVERGVLDEKTFWKRYVEMRIGASSGADARAFFAQYERADGDTVEGRDVAEVNRLLAALPTEVNLAANSVVMDMRSEEHRSAALELAHRFNRHGKLVVEAYLPQRADAKATLDAVVLDELRSDGRPDSTADAAAAATAVILQNPLRSSASMRTPAVNARPACCTTRAAVQATAQALREYGEQVERAGDAV